MRPRTRFIRWAAAWTAIGGAAALLILTSPAAAQKHYGPGVSDTEIKIGQTMAYTGPASAYATQGRVEAAYYAMINQQGGINERKIVLISLDDGYSPPRTFEQTRRLVEQDNVLAVVGSVGTAPNSAIQKYLNANEVPHILAVTGATRFDDPKRFPWTMSGIPSYDMEAGVYARYVLQTKTAPRIAVLYQNDDLGKDYLKGLKGGLGKAAATMIAKEASYELSDPTVDSQIASLKGSGADTFFSATTPKFSALAIRRSYGVGWRPLYLQANVASSFATVIKPAGPEKSIGLITAGAFKSPLDPTWADDPGMREYLAFVKARLPDADPADGSTYYGYTIAQLAVLILRRCGDELTRANVMNQATTLADVDLPMLLPGIRLSNNPVSHAPFHSLRMQRFDGTKWVLFGDVVGAHETASR